MNKVSMVFRVAYKHKTVDKKISFALPCLSYLNVFCENEAKTDVLA